MKGAEMPSGNTRWFGRNLRASALGVVSVWMKIVRRDCAMLGIVGGAVTVDQAVRDDRANRGRRPEEAEDGMV